MTAAISSQTPATGYVPGVCNINKDEIAYRRKAGYLGIAAYGLLLAGLLVFSFNPWFGLVLFLPAFIGAVCMLQATYKFCVSYAASGQQHALDDDPEAQAIVDAASRKLDKQRARKINVQSALIALVAAALAVALLFSR